MIETHSVIHPLAKRVPLRGGSLFVVVQPFSMAVAREARPILVRIARGLVDAGDSLDLGSIVEKYEPDVLELVQRAVTLPDGVDWLSLDYEDFLCLAQAVWETSILRADGGGILGKVLSLTAGVLRLRRGLFATVSGQPSNGAAAPPPPSGTEPQAKN